jgi:hypothetical protein
VGKEHLHLLSLSACSSVDWCLPDRSSNIPSRLVQASRDLAVLSVRTAMLLRRADIAVSRAGPVLDLPSLGNARAWLPIGAPEATRLLAVGTGVNVKHE